MTNPNQNYLSFLASVNPKQIAQNNPIRDYQQFADDEGSEDDFIEVDGHKVPKAVYQKVLMGGKNDGRRETLSSLKEQFPQLAQQVDQNLPVRRQIDEINQQISDLSNAVIDNSKKEAQTQAKKSVEEQVADATAKMKQEMEQERAQIRLDSFKEQVKAEAIKTGLKSEFKDLLPEALNIRYKISVTDTGGIAIYDKNTDAQVTGEAGFANASEIAKMLKDNSGGMFAPKANAPGVGGGIQGNIAATSQGGKDWDIANYSSAKELFNEGISDGEISLPGDMTKGHDRRI